MSDQRIILVYEEIPERTVILYLSLPDLEAAGLSYKDLVSIHGTYVNNSDIDDAQKEIHDRVSQAIFGEWIEATGSQVPALWQNRKIVQTNDDALSRVGVPPKIDLGAIVIHCGFAL